MTFEKFVHFSLFSSKLALCTFSKISSRVVLYGKCSSDLTFEKCLTWSVSRKTNCCVNTSAKSSHSIQSLTPVYRYSPWLYFLCSHVCGRTHFYASNDSFVCVMWNTTEMLRQNVSQILEQHPVLNPYIQMFSTVIFPLFTCVWRDPFLCVAWLIRGCDVHTTEMFRQNVSQILAQHPVLNPYIQIFSMVIISLFTCVWQEPFLCVTWLIRVCDVTHKRNVASKRMPNPRSALHIYRALLSRIYGSFVQNILDAVLCTASSL